MNTNAGKDFEDDEGEDDGDELEDDTDADVDADADDLYCLVLSGYGWTLVRINVSCGLL